MSSAPPAPSAAPLGPPRVLVYEIFVDRFAGPGGGPLAPPPEGVDPWAHHAGGTLDGISARLDHLSALGVDALYLTPVFRARTNHKYDTESFDEVDPAFGGEPAFAALAAAARARGMGLFLDGVFNHVGERHDWFERARRDPLAREARFFQFTRHPDDYSRWRGFGFLPELALDQPEVRAALFEGTGSVLGRGLARGATGWRLDCANDLGLSVCRAATESARALGARDGVIGEVMAYAEDWVAEGRLDGVMSYWFRESVLGLATGRVSAAQAGANLARIAARYPRDALLRSWNVLATHDTPRLRAVVPDPRARALVWTLAFTAPGTPLVYYGEEIGMEGGPDPDNRRVMRWDEESWELETLALVIRLAQLRRERPALLAGDLVLCEAPGAPELLVFLRVTREPEEVVLVIANAAPSVVSARVFLPYSFLFDHLPLVDLLGVAPVHTVLAGRVDVQLAPHQVLVLAPDDTTIPGYRFFRRR